MNEVINKRDGMFILFCFIAFFSLIIIVNGIFITMALKTHSGVVVEQPYEKGLAFNEVLKTAKAQKDIEHILTYTDRVLRWTLPVENAFVTASIIRPVREGHDFEITLQHTGNGIYEAQPTIPFPGIWIAKLKATWKNQTFQASHELIVE